MDINVTVKLTCDEYISKLMFAAIEFFENIKEGQTPLASVPKMESAPAQMMAPAVQETPPIAVTPIPAPAPTPAPEKKVDLAAIREKVVNWLSQDKDANQPKLRAWLTEQDLNRVSDIKTVAQAESLDALIGGAANA